jgi:hypothetical protein
MAKKQASKGKRTKKAAKPAASESMAARRRKARMKQRSGTKPRSPAGPTVLIHRDPKLTTPHGVIEYEAISRLYWENESGGHGGKTDGVFLAGYVWCNQIPNLDEFPHNCQHGSGPHAIRVFVLEDDNDIGIYRKLEARAHNRS